MEGAGALQHRRRRLRPASAREAGDGLGASRRGEPRARLGRAAGPREPGRTSVARARGEQGRPGRGRAAADARDGSDLLRHLEAGRAAALDVGPLRRRRDPPPARGLDPEGAGHRRGQRRALRPVAGRDDAGARARAARGTPHRADLRGHLGRRPGAALLHLRDHRQGEGHRPRPPLHPRPRGVRLLPPDPRRRELPRDGRVGMGGRDLPPARPLAPRRGPVRVPARGRLRPRRPARLPLPPPGLERVHDPDRDAGDDGDLGRRRALSAGVPDRLLGGGAAQPRGDPLVPRSVRGHGARLLRAHRVLSAVRELPLHGGARGLDGPDDAGMGRPDPRRGREPGRARRARGDLPPRALQPALPDRLLEPARGDRGGLRRRLVPHQGRGDHGRRRLRLVRRARRRRDHRGRLPDRTVRGRVSLHRAPGGARGGRGRFARRAQGQRGQGVHRARRRPRALGRAGEGDPGLRPRSGSAPTPTRARSSSPTSCRRP